MGSTRKRQNPRTRQRSVEVSQRFLGHRPADTDLAAPIPVPIVPPLPHLRMDRPFVSRARPVEAKVPFITPDPPAWNERAFVQQAEARPMRTQPRLIHWP